MLKRTIYSVMALSLTLMPISDVMAAITDNTSISSGETIINGGNQWTGGKITNEGGTLNIQGDSVNYNITPIPNYIQTGGNLNLSNGANLTLEGTSSDQAKISGGSVSVGDVSTLTISSGAGITKDATVTLNAGGTIDLRGVPIAGDSSLVLNSGDTWNGTIKISTIDGVLRIADAFEKSGVLNQTSGTLQIGDVTSGASLTLGNSGDSISGGRVSIFDNSTLSVKEATISDYADINLLEGGTLIVNGGTAILNSDDDWNGAVSLTEGTLTLKDRVDETSTDKTYNQTGGSLELEEGSFLTINENSKIDGGNVNIKNGSSLFFANKENNNANIKMDNETSSLTIDGANLTLVGTIEDQAKISGGAVTVGNDSTLTISAGAGITKDATVTLNEGGTIDLIGVPLGDDPSLVLNSGDTWAGKIKISKGDGVLQIADNFNKSGVLNQEGGVLQIGDYESKPKASLILGNSGDSISGGVVSIFDNSTLLVTEHNDNQEATILDAAEINLLEGGTLTVAGNGTAILNDTKTSVAGADDWAGHVVVFENGKLTLKNVEKDFTTDEMSTLTIAGNGTVNIYANERGGSKLTINDYYDEESRFLYDEGAKGQINVKGYDSGKISSFTTKITKNGDIKNFIPVNLEGNAELAYDLNNNIKATLDLKNKGIKGSGPNNTVVQKGNGTLTLDSANKNLEIGANVRVENGKMVVNANNLTIGTTYKDASGNDVKYGDLQIGKKGNTKETHFETNALYNNIYGNMAMYDGWYKTTNPASLTTVGKNLYVGSGIDMMQGQLNRIDVAGTTTVDNLKLKIDVDPATYLSDMINSSKVVANPNSTLDLVDYNLLSIPRDEKYTFRVVNAANENYQIGAGAKKIVSQNKLTITPVGSYQMIPSAVKGAFDMVLVQHNPQVFRGQVPPNVIYANQLVITNQLFDRMLYSNLPYFNGDCTNKTAAAKTLFSPYQYSNNDTGLWFKPYANIETIRMTHVGDVKNNSYGAMIGADFAKKKWGEWSFIPTAFIGYNGGRSTYHGYGIYGGAGMWHNGGQAGFMGTFTRKEFVTMLAAYAGGYHNIMDVNGYTDRNALWNVGVASKTAYNIHLPWDFILQPSVYMAYNYVGSSSFESDYDGFMHKVDPLNAFSVAPGVSLIWQKETFSLYGIFQAMFNVASTVGGSVAEIDLPQVGLRDPYFEYGLGASKFFKDRFSGYGQVVARSGSRRGVGFQLGMNMKL